MLPTSQHQVLQLRTVLTAQEHAVRELTDTSRSHFLRSGFPHQAHFSHPLRLQLPTRTLAPTARTEGGLRLDTRDKGERNVHAVRGA